MVEMAPLYKESGAHSSNEQADAILCLRFYIR